MFPSLSHATVGQQNYFCGRGKEGRKGGSECLFPLHPKGNLYKAPYEFLGNRRTFWHTILPHMILWKLFTACASYSAISQSTVCEMYPQNRAWQTGMPEGPSIAMKIKGRPVKIPFRAFIPTSMFLKTNSRPSFLPRDSWRRQHFRLLTTVPNS